MVRGYVYGLASLKLAQYPSSSFPEIAQAGLKFPCFSPQNWKNWTIGQDWYRHYIHQ